MSHNIEKIKKYFMDGMDLFSKEIVALETQGKIKDEKIKTLKEQIKLKG